VILIVDMQNDFAREGGALYNPEAAATISTTRELSERARVADIPVWYTQDTHYERSPEWDVWGPHAGRDCLVICGTVANICVHYTAASAALHLYDVVHPVDGISSLTGFDRHAAFGQASWLFGAELVHAVGLRFGSGK